MAKPAITVVSSFTYRGTPEEFSNKFHFTGNAPGDDASWKTLADSLIAAMRSCVGSEVTFHRVYGYNDGDQPSVYSHDYTVPGPPLAGTLPFTGGAKVAGDQAAWLRWETPKRNSKGKIVYARKYFHGVYSDGPGGPDYVMAAARTNLTLFGTKCVDGSISSVFHICLPDGTPGSNPSPGYYMTTRTLKRRGKRPPT